MKTLHLYLTRQVLATLVMTVVVFTFVLLLGNVLKEILALLVNQQASLGTVFKALGLLIPFVLVFALPMGMLTATLLVFGRFSADHELTAVRAGGVSLIALVTPILILSVLLSIVCAWVNLELAPRCRVAYKDLLYSVGMSSPLGLLPEKQFIRDLPGGYTVYIENRNDEHLRDIFIHQTNEKEKSSRWFRAPAGQISHNVTNNTMRLMLFDATGAIQENNYIQPLHGEMTIDLDLNPAKDRKQEIKLSDMTFLQLREKIKELEQLPAQAQPLPTNAPPELLKQLDALKTWQKDWATPAKVQLNRMVSFSFACIGFTLIGIPLGIRAHRRETSIGIAIALVLVALYYSFIILGESLDTNPELGPHLIVWLPNFIFQAVGAVLLSRANRGV